VTAPILLPVPRLHLFLHRAILQPPVLAPILVLAPRILHQLLHRRLHPSPALPPTTEGIRTKSSGLQASETDIS
jgi:hypothetical protein